VNIGELPRTEHPPNERFQACPKTLTNAAERTPAGSKTAGCRFDSCPTCPENLNLSRLQPSWLQPIFCAVTPFDPNGSITGSYMRYAHLVIEVLVQQGFQLPSLSVRQLSAIPRYPWTYPGE
jgi:hypothetical protein